MNALNGLEIFEANTQSSKAQQLSDYKFLPRVLLEMKHIWAEWVAKSLSMDKLIPAQKAASLTGRFPFQLCRHSCRYLT